MSDNESESRETVADIVAEMRDLAVLAEKCMASIRPSVVMDFADRVETAARRERDHAVEHATRHAEAVARDNCRDCVHNPRGHNYDGGNAAAMRDIVTALANVILPPRGKADEDGCLAWVRAMQEKARAALADATTKKSSAVGNAAAMREALKEIVLDCQYAIEGIFDQGDYGCNHLSRVRDKAHAALSAPARNCDVYKTPEDCMRAFESYVREHGKLGFINPFTEVVKWLFAPAAERKGEGDGN